MSESGDDPISGEIRLRGGHETISFPEIPDTVVEALHRSIVGDRQHMEIREKDVRIISLQDVRQLCTRLSQWMEDYDVKSERFRIIITNIEDKTHAIQRDNFSDVESLIRYDFSVNRPTQSIEIYQSIILRKPSDGVYHQIDAVIEFNRFNPTMEIDISESDLMGITLKNNAPFGVKIEYSEYIVAKNIMTMILEWYRQLDEPIDSPQKGFLGKVLSRHSSHFISPGLIISSASSVLSAIIAIGIYRLGFDDSGVIGLAYSAFIFLIIYHAVRLANTYLSAKFSGSLRIANTEPNIRFTKGDERLNDKFLEELKTKSKSADFWKVAILTSFVVNIITGLILNLWPTIVAFISGSGNGP